MASIVSVPSGYPAMNDSASDWPARCCSVPFGGGVASVGRMSASPAQQLANSVQAGPSVNALLLGSGVSVSAGLPTGKEIVCDLIECLANSQCVDTEGDPIGWYRRHEGHEPDYRTLLATAAPSPADRRNLLSKYFEPRGGRDGGGPAPTRAHRAIARLIADGFVSVIVTTNFDRLLETALTDAGIHPQVIHNAATAEGAEALQHCPCTIIKVNGDYVSSDLRNTVEELDSFESAISALLSRVFGEYGLIVCGWSASLDAALRETLLRTSNRIYSTFWMERGSLTPEAAGLVDHRQAIRVPIEDADSAFEHLADAVSALRQASVHQPVANTTSLHQLKQYISGSSQFINLHDLMVRETALAIGAVADLPTSSDNLDAAYPEQMRQYEAATLPLLTLLATGTYFSRGEEQDQLWVAAVDRLARREMSQSGNRALLNMQQYPTLLAMYVTALGAAAANRIAPIAGILGAVKIVIAEPGVPRPVGVAVSSIFALDAHRMMTAMPKLRKSQVPVSQHLFDVLRPTVADIVPDDRRYSELFDQVEYLIGLACTAQIGVGPLGLEAYRRLEGRLRLPDDMVQLDPSAFVAAGVFASAAHLNTCREVYGQDFQGASSRARKLFGP